MTETPRVGVCLVGLRAPLCPHFHVDHATVWSASLSRVDERQVEMPNE